MSNGNNTLAGRILKISRFKKTLLVSSGLLIWDPHRLLRIINLGLISPLHVHRRQKKLSGVWVDSPLHQFDMARHRGMLRLLVCLIQS